MGPRRRPLVTIVLLAALIAMPGLDAVCLAACEPGTAGTEAAVASHDDSAGCHDMANAEARVESGTTSACGGSEQAVGRADAVPTPSRDIAAPLPAATRIATATHLTGAPFSASTRTLVLPPPDTSRASLSVVLRI